MHRRHDASKPDTATLRASRRAALLSFVAAPLVLAPPRLLAAPADTGATDFMVSAVLRGGEAHLTIQLVHAVKRGRSSEEASGIFLKQVLAEFPGYSVINVLVSGVRVVPPECRQRSNDHVTL